MPAPLNSNAQPGSTGVADPINASDASRLDEAQRAAGRDPKTDPPAPRSPDEPIEPTRLPNDPPLIAKDVEDDTPAPRIVDSRENIYKRFRNHRGRAEGDTDFQQVPEDFERIASFDGKAPEQAAPATSAPPVTDPATPALDPLDEAITLKVNHQTFSVTKRQAALMAGLPEADAKALSVDGLTRIAQIAEANRLRATRAPDPAPVAPPQAPVPPTPVPVASPAPPQAPAYDFDKIMFGDPEEQKQEFAKAIRAEAQKIVSETRQAETEQDRLTSASRDIAMAMQEMVDRAPDLAGDEVGSAVLADQSVKLMIETLVSVGAPRAELDAMRGSPGQILDIYRQTLAAGQRIEAPRTLIQRAEQTTRTILNRAAPQAPVPQSTPVQQPSALMARVAAKQALPQVSSRSGFEPGTARGPDPQLSTRSSAIAKMKAARGQQVPGA